MDHGICAQTDAEAFFPDKGQSTKEAKRVCLGCEVRTECLTYALEHDERFGVWGGLSERERRKVKRGDLSAIEKLAHPKPLRACEQCGKTLYERRGSAPGRFCSEHCRSQFKYYHPGHGTLRRYKQGCSCPACCRANNNYVSLKRGRQPETRICPNCEHPFETGHSQRKYCSPRCRHLATIRMRREKYQSHANTVCITCNGVIANPSPRGLYCSPQCRTQVRKARRRAPMMRACAVCGDLFNRKRSRAKHCSEMCRGIASRRRDTARRIPA